MERLNRFIVHTVPWLTLGMVLVTFVVVILRYLFGRGWVWMQEIALYMHAFTFPPRGPATPSRATSTSASISSTDPWTNDARPWSISWAARCC